MKTNISTFCEMNNGVRDGLFYILVNDILVATGRYKDDKRDGFWIGAYLNGNPRCMGKFEKGKKTGAWSYFNKDGALTEIVDEHKSYIYEDKLHFQHQDWYYYLDSPNDDILLVNVDDGDFTIVINSSELRHEAEKAVAYDYERNEDGYSEAYFDKNDVHNYMLDNLVEYASEKLERGEFVVEI